jgi:hypothetical protein
VAVASKLLKGLSEETILWLRSVARKLEESYNIPKTPEEVAEETVDDRLRNLQEAAPEMFRLYQDLPLQRSLSNRDVDLGLIDPERFKTLAAPLPMQDPLVRKEIDSNIKQIQERAKFKGLLGTKVVTETVHLKASDIKTLLLNFHLMVHSHSSLCLQRQGLANSSMHTRLP